MATSEYCSCPPRLPTPTASHVAIASGVNHRVTSPRWTSARSYAGQFPTRYFVLYLGCTLDFTSRSCPFGRHDGQGRDEHLLPRTNAEIGYLAYDAHAADLLFQIVSRRYEHRPLLMTTNLAFKHWDTIFPNASCAVALVDRLTHHAEIVVIEGDSYRKREAELSQKQRRTKTRKRR